MGINGSNSADSSGEVTRLLRKLCAGDKQAADELFPIVYDELRALARQLMLRERFDHTLQPTALVNEAYMKVAGGLPHELENRRHFLRIAARAMRQVLVEYARARLADKRGCKPIRVELTDGLLVQQTDEQMLALEEALQRLEKLDARQAQIVDLRYFAGRTEEETAVVVGVSESTVKRDWLSAKAWLYSEMTK